MIVERLEHYARIKIGGRGLSDVYRFQSPPSDKYPQIYRKFDNLLNHKSRLVRCTKLWLGDILGEDEIVELQLKLICHDVMELVNGDISRLGNSSEEGDSLEGVNRLLKLEDEIRFADFVKAQLFLEDKKVQGPPPGDLLSCVARWIDTIDGNIIAYELLTTYIQRAGMGGDPIEGVFDPIPGILMASITYVNKMRGKYRSKLADAQKTNNRHNVDLEKILTRLLDIEATKLGALMQRIKNCGYEVGEVV